MNPTPLLASLPLGIATGLLEVSFENPLVRFLGRFHPLVVHFPIGLLLAALGIEIWQLWHKQKKPAKATLITLGLGALGATLAAGLGWLLAEAQGPEKGLEELLFRHRWGGVSVAVLSWLLFWLGWRCAREEAFRHLPLFRLGLLLLGGAVGVTGHWGASMVYGPDYLLEPFQKSAPASGSREHQHGNSAQRDHKAPSPRRQLALEMQQLFQEHCYRCHGPRRSRGKLRLDRESVLFPKERSLWVVLPGHPEESELFERVSLPVGQKHHMPRRGPPLNQRELDLVRRWILAGAPWTGK